MPTRNTVVLSQLIEALGPLVTSPAEALARLEQVYADQLLIVAGDTNKVAEFAEELRLRITMHEAGQVLDYVGRHKVAGLTIDQAEDAINFLFTDRFQEP